MGIGLWLCAAWLLCVMLLVDLVVCVGLTKGFFL